AKPSAKPAARPPAQAKQRAQAGANDEAARLREKKAAWLDSLVARARKLADEVQHEPLNRRFTEVLTTYVPGRAKALTGELRGGQGTVPQGVLQEANRLGL